MRKVLEPAVKLPKERRERIEKAVKEVVAKGKYREGFEAGKAMVKLYQNDGNVAMLVAGYNAEDTRRATRVVANYDSSAFADSFTGDEIVITGTSLTDIQVSAPE